MASKIGKIKIYFQQFLNFYSQNTNEEKKNENSKENSASALNILENPMKTIKISKNLLKISVSEKLCNLYKKISIINNSS